MSNGNIVFFGTSWVGIPFLQELKKTFSLRLIITQPDSKGGRCREIICPPVKSFAETHRLALLQPEKMRNQELFEAINRIKPDIGVVIGYGKLIPERLYSLPAFNTVNVHFSLLPRFRGAAPVQRALEAGEKRTGISVFEIDRQMDTGPLWARKEFDILPMDTSESLMERLSREGAPFLSETIRRILDGSLRPQPQDNSLASYAPPLQKQEGRVDWNLTARQIFNKYRAFTPWPGLFFLLKGKTMKIKKALPPGVVDLKTLTGLEKPGQILELNRKRLQVCCGNQTVLSIEEFQPQGKKPMTPYCYSLGNPLPDLLN
jgi:methionyl-tRNA formyltransferase